MITPLTILFHQLLFGTYNPCANIHKILINNFLNENTSDFWSRPQDALPGCSSNEEASGFLAEDFVDKAAALVEGHAIVTNNTAVFLLYYKMLNFLKFKPNFYDSFLNKSNLSKFLSLVGNHKAIFIANRLQIIEKLPHKLLVRLVQPRVMLLINNHIENIGLPSRLIELNRLFKLEKFHEATQILLVEVRHQQRIMHIIRQPLPY